MRAFVGIELDSEWSQALTSTCTYIQNTDAAWHSEKWVPTENLHITLKFLGEITESTASELAKKMTGLTATLSPFTLYPDTLVEAIPNAMRATMLWSTFLDSEGKCSQLAKRIEQTASGFGVSSDGKSYVPHVTLVRSRHRQAFTHAGDAQTVAASSLLESGVESMSVRAVTLFRSELGRGRPRYERLITMPLGG